MNRWQNDPLVRPSQVGVEAEEAVQQLRERGRLLLLPHAPLHVLAPVVLFPEPALPVREVRNVLLCVLREKPPAAVPKGVRNISGSPLRSSLRNSSRKATFWPFLPSRLPLADHLALDRGQLLRRGPRELLHPHVRRGKVGRTIRLQKKRGILRGVGNISATL